MVLEFHHSPNSDIALRVFVWEVDIMLFTITLRCARREFNWEMDIKWI